MGLRQDVSVGLGVGPRQVRRGDSRYGTGGVPILTCLIVVSSGSLSNWIGHYLGPFLSILVRLQEGYVRGFSSDTWETRPVKSQSP